MIKSTLKRNNGSECDPIVRTLDPLEALGHLAFYEIGFGGKLTDCDMQGASVSLTIVTHVLQCVDTATFEGTFVEMLPLVNFVQLYHLLRETQPDPVIGSLVKRLEHDLGEQAGNPGLITISAQVLLGSLPHIKGLFLVAAGVTDPDMFRQAMRHSNDDIVAALQIARDERCGLVEALALAA